MTSEKATWRNTFNSDIAPWMWGNIARALDMARVAGYPFISWNGRIYRTGDAAMNEGLGQCVAFTRELDGDVA